ncbi:MAG TPA: hypothetical protein DDX39_04215 [Bacteroidales bacterium]|nr:MAG: hypothetical protein A2W98_09375 [Bacteroidetes bacterium GWF2_33_38]OFY71505.1 MAG: hypothetical protein A2265_06640 [Bacteroidetes bacterium RIFOXYA12_FULL_33_9]OFY90869.1 MAG: hypothetical protein A2236_12180 [Bacteroidetes bacterium RIFOXYA2_FULL_33_7]HBF87827.1 hypothetical protein [Bacteroidales bacterium]
MKLLLYLLILANVSCGISKQNSNDLTIEPDTVIVFSDLIKFTGQYSNDFGGLSFKPISVFFDDKLIFKDTINEYWLTGYESTQYPKFLKCADGSCQLLIEVDERPNQNELTQLTISKDGKIEQERLPVFNWNPVDIDNDEKLELSGILSNGETIENGDTAFYNPTIVYELTDNCLTLDSLATIEKNKKIWGQFYGYHYNDSLLLPFDRRDNNR